MNNRISCIGKNYRLRDGDMSEPFFMATHYEQKKEELCNQVKEFRESIDTSQYDNIILIGTSLGGVLFNQLMDYFGEKVKQLFIIGYPTGYIDTTKLSCPTVIIQGEYDKYGGISAVKENIIGNVDHITFHEIANAEHSFYDIHNPSIRYIDQVNQIITNTIIKL